MIVDVNGKDLFVTNPEVERLNREIDAAIEREWRRYLEWKYATELQVVEVGR